MKSICRPAKHQRGIEAESTAADSCVPIHQGRTAKARAIIVSLGLLLLSGQAMSDEPTGATFTGVGLLTCGQFAQKYREDPALAEVIFTAWMQGWLSGYNNALFVHIIAGGKGARGEEVELDPALGMEQVNKYLINLAPAGFGPKEQWDFVLGFCSEAPLKTFREAVANVQGILREWPKEQ